MYRDTVSFAGVSTATAELVKTRFIKNVYSWMAGGLGVTAATSLMVLKSETPPNPDSGRSPSRGQRPVGSITKGRQHAAKGSALALWDYLQTQSSGPSPGLALPP